MANGTPSAAGSVAPWRTNVLRAIAPTLRIKVRLGDLDAVFQPVNTVQGKKQRLQALGYYYEVIAAATANTATEAYTNCLNTYSRNNGPFANAAAAEASLQSWIRKFVVVDGVLPAVGGQVQIKLPGAITFSNNSDLGAGGIADGSALKSIRFNDEATLWAGNPALGKIPLIATVEEQVDGAWSPSPRRLVHFQLIAPFYDAAGSELAQVNSLRNQSEQGTAAASNIVANIGPRPYITNAMGFSFAAADPQRYNCHSSRGGKRGLAVFNNVLDALPVSAFAGMDAAKVSSHANAAQAQTNAKGEAGVLLLPSRMGGDVYRLRIFVDPIGIRISDGTGAGAVVFETGRFQVIKHVRWTLYVEKPAPVLPAKNTAEGIQARLSILGYDTGPIDGTFGGQSVGALTAFQTNYSPPLAVNGDPTDGPTQTQLDNRVTTYLNTIGQPLGSINFATVTSQFAQMNCIIDTNQAKATPKMKESDYVAAIRWARGQAQANQGTYGLSQNYNINAMIEDTFNTPHLFSIRHPAYYNRTRGAGVPAATPAPNYGAYWTDARNVIYGNGRLLEMFMQYIAGHASAAHPPTANLTRYSTPGLTVVRTLAASQLMFAPNEANQVQVPAADNLTGASGIAVPQRGCFVFYGSKLYVNWPYKGDGLTKNTMHEMGHTLYLRHHRTKPGGLHANASFREDHDNADRCLMGYLFCEGEYCAKCHLKLRGWDISKLPV